MSGRGRGGVRGCFAAMRHAMMVALLAGSTFIGVVGPVAPQPVHAQDQSGTSEGEWVDPAADQQWKEISDNVDQTIEDTWDGGAGDGTQAGAVDTAPVAAAAVPTYDENGNLIDPVTGAPLAIGADGNPIDAAAGLYFDNAGNLVDPATGLTMTWDENGQLVPVDASANATTETTADGTDASAAPADESGSAEELVTTPWLAPPPSGPPPGFQNWSPPTTVYIPEAGQSIDGVFLDAWRNWGGVTSWGLPLTQEFQENGVTVQYYDNGRFEYRPDDPNGVVVQFGELGRQMQPFMLRRTSGSGSAEANEAALTALAWAPLDQETVRPDSDAWRYIPETGHGVAGAFKSFWEESGESGYLGNPLTEPYKVDGVTYQVFERDKLAQSAGESPTVVPVGKMMVERLRLDTTPIAQGDLPVYSEELFTPPPVTAVNGAPVDPNGEKWVLVNVTLQYLWAYQGDQVLWQGYVSTGRAGFETPPGSFRVLSKIPVQTMEGVIGGEYYNVPNVPDVMYFTDVGHALHGTYWHNNFGTPMSHGCVNLPMDVAAWMYQWAPIGMRVEITP